MNGSTQGHEANLIATSTDPELTRLWAELADCQRKRVNRSMLWATDSERAALRSEACRLTEALRRRLREIVR